MLVLDRWQLKKLERVLFKNLTTGYDTGKFFSKLTITKPAGLTIANAIRQQRKEIDGDK